LERLIRPLAQDWNSVPNPSKDIERWERENRRQLPDDYRRFLLTYNGGRVYPLIFRYSIRLEFYPSDDATTFVDPLYEWAYVEEIHSGAVFGEGLPPVHLSIGSNPGDLEILISFQEKTYGQILCWLHSSTPWGEEGNDRMWRQSSSFTDFMGSLFENADNAGYEHWFRPGLKHLQKELRF
jgi:SMI1 / KNR4 family (SUKH-1)